MSILEQATETGSMLFAQPATFLFDWSAKDTSSPSRLVVSPALIKIFDHDGNAMSPKREILAAIVKEA